MSTVTLLNRGQRGPGTFETASYVVPNTVLTAAVQFDPHNNEMNTTKIVKFDVFVSDDDGATWRHDMGAVAQGPWTTRPWIETDGSRFWGKRIRAVIDLPQQINCGIVLYINETPPSPPGW